MSKLSSPLKGAVASAILGCLIWSTPAHALLITANFIGFGSAADEQTVFETAIDWWEQIITDDFNFSVDVTRELLGGSTLGVTSNFVADGTGRPQSSDISMDIRDDWFVDLTPHLNEEFNLNLGDPFSFTAIAGGDADGLFDYLSVSKHELGHALGFTVFYGLFSALVEDEMDSERAFSDIGFLGPTNQGTHTSTTSHPNDLMNAFFNTGQRRIQSDLDCAMLTEAFGYECNVGLHKIPEPPSIVIFGFGLAGASFFLMLSAARRRRGDYIEP